MTPNDLRTTALDTHPTELPTPKLVWRDFLMLGKAGITAMVLVTTAAGILLAPASVSPLQWALTLLGTALVSAGSAALNQVVERHIDARMQRTARRPIPSGRMPVQVALMAGVLAAVTGTTILALAATPLAATIALLTLVGYVAVYTPFKRVSSLSTIVGAFPGAAPPLIGWAAATGSLDVGAWALFGLLFLWQMPHFLAIAWLYQDDYQRGGFPLIAIGDLGARRTGRQAVLYTTALVPVSLLPTALGLTGPVYLVGALLLGLAFLGLAGAFSIDPNRTTARRLLFASILYLPLVLVLLVVGRL
jgi:protoheme IX farnesyltransferase